MTKLTFVCKKQGDEWKATCKEKEDVEASAASEKELEEELSKVFWRALAAFPSSP